MRISKKLIPSQAKRYWSRWRSASMRHPERGQRPACFMGRGCVREGRVYLDGYGVVSLWQRAGGVPLALFIVPLQEGCGKFPAGRTKFRPPDEEVTGLNFELSTTHPNLVSKQVGITLGVSALSQQVAMPSRWLLLANYSKLSNSPTRSFLPRLERTHF